VGGFELSWQRRWERGAAETARPLGQAPGPHPIGDPGRFKSVAAVLPVRIMHAQDQLADPYVNAFNEGKK
jgi:hypothetical protein